MTPVIFAPRAAADIAQIFDYTADRWSLDQAELYIRQIKKAVETLAADPLRGRPCDDIRPGFRRCPVGTHTIFYHLTGSSLTIVRVLHQQMDVDQHL